MWKPKQQLNLCTRNWLCKGFFVALFCGFVAVPARAELSQAQLTAAFLEALKEYAEFSTGDPYALPTVGYTDSIAEDTMAQFLSGTSSGNGVVLNDVPIANIVARWYVAWYRTVMNSNSVSNDVARLAAFLPVVTNEIRGIGSYLYDSSSEGHNATIGDSLGVIQRTLEPLDFRFDSHGYEVLVAAPDIESQLALLGTMERNQSDILSLLYQISWGDIDSVSSNVFQMGDVVAGSVSNSAAEIIDYFDQDVSTDYDEGQDEGSEDSDYDDYDDIPLPTSQEDYTIRADDTQGPTTDDILENVSSLGVSHSPILQLVAAPSRLNPTAPIPEIEVDFGRDAPFASFCLALNDLTEWLYPILGMLLFSLKGVNMWRLVRQASIAASASGDVPVIHLAYDPF